MDGRENRDAVLGSKKGSPLTKAVGRVNITTTNNAEKGKKGDGTKRSVNYFFMALTKQVQRMKIPRVANEL